MSYFEGTDIRELGSVNVDSIEEYKNLKQRYDFMCEQRNFVTCAFKSSITLNSSVCSSSFLVNFSFLAILSFFWKRWKRKYWTWKTNRRNKKANRRN